MDALHESVHATGALSFVVHLAEYMGVQITWKWNSDGTAQAHEPPRDYPKGSALWAKIKVGGGTSVSGGFSEITKDNETDRTR